MPITYFWQRDTNLVAGEILAGSLCDNEDAGGISQRHGVAVRPSRHLPQSMHTLMMSLSDPDGSVGIQIAAWIPDQYLFDIRIRIQQGILSYKQSTIYANFS